LEATYIKSLPSLYYKSKRLARKSEFLKQFILLIAAIFKTPYLKSLIPVLFSLAISLELKLGDFKHFPIYIAIFVTLALYFTFIILSVNVDKYTEATNSRYNYLKEIINNQIGINHHISNKLFNEYKSISSLKAGYAPTKADLDSLRYQDAGILVCHAIYNIIRNVTNEDEHQVTLMHKIEERSGSYHTKMIAYANKNDTPPIGFKSIYRPDDNPKEHHQKLFEKNINNIYVLENYECIKREFFEDDKDKEKDLKMQQYVAFPVYCEEKGIISLLQIETSIQGAFGKTSEEVEDFMHFIMPFVHQLSVNYYRENLVNCLVKKVEILSKRRKKEAYL